MKLPRYFEVGEVKTNEEGLCVNISIKWWGFPILYFKTFKKDFKANLFGWVYVIYKMPFIWYKWYKKMQEV